MVKNQTIFLDHAPRAHGHSAGDPSEKVTVQDMSVSIAQMVQTGTVGAMSSVLTREGRYTFPDIEDDADGHSRPDYEKLSQRDIVEKTEYVEEVLSDFEKKKDESKHDDSERPKDAEKKAEEAGASDAVSK